MTEDCAALAGCISVRISNHSTVGRDGLARGAWISIFGVLMDSRKTVLILTPGARTRAGGIAKIVDHTVRNWPADSKFNLRVVDTYGTGGPVRGAIQMPFYFAGAMLSVLAALLSGNVDILHVNMTERLSVWRKLSFALLGIIFGVPVVMHMHGADFTEYFEQLPKWRQKIVRRIMHSCSITLVLGAYWKQLVAISLAIPINRIRILYNAVPLAAEPGRKSGAKCRLLFLGIVGERKGVDTLLSALAHPLMATADWEAIIGGNGEVSRFKALATELGLAGRVKFTGLLDAASVAEEFRQADVFVLPSRNEGLPVALIEAMSHGCAIVSTPVGSIADAIISEQTGLLVDIGDSDALAKALFRLVESRELRVQLGAAARTKFAASFTLPNYISELHAVYENVSLQPVATRGVRYQRPIM